MTIGSILAIHVRPGPGHPARAVESARARPKRGLDGDYNVPDEEDAPAVAPDTELTLVEAEALAGLEREYGIVLGAAESRRNVLTSGIALNPLVGCEFRLGSVRCRGIELCDPCRHLESTTQSGVLKGLAHRGGLRAQILAEGVIRVGDPIEAVPAARS